MLKDLSSEELEKLIERHKREYEKLKILADSERAKSNAAYKELLARNEWARTTVLNRMVEQLNSLKDEISVGWFNNLHDEIVKAGVANPNQSRLERNRRVYTNGALMGNLYFDLMSLIHNQLDLVTTKKKFSRYLITFEFDNKKKIIHRRITSAIFSTKDGFEFIIDRKDVLQLARMISNNFKKSYTDYRDIIPDIVKTVRFLENDFKDIVMGYYLSKC